jgi:hypothetical protein
MKYNLSNPLQARQAVERLAHLVGQGAWVELTRKRQNRSLPQNNYLHLILTAWGRELGYDLDEIKQVVKMRLMPSLFEYKKQGVILYRSTAALDTAQMTALIDKIRITAMENTGYYIPAPNETELLQAMEYEAERFS